MPNHRKGHVKALQKVYEDLYPSLCIQGRIMGASDAVVRDAIQDVFLELLEKKSIRENIKKIKPYIKVALRHRIAKATKVRFTDLDEKLMDPVKSYERYLIEQQSTENLKTSLQKAIMSLTDAQKMIITLRFYDGMNYEEIAEQEKITVRTVYNQMHKAIKTLRNFKIDRS